MLGHAKLEFDESDNSAGSCSLDSLQFRGHGHYSDLQVPWSVECLEYAWLVEVLIGEIGGKISPGEVELL